MEQLRTSMTMMAVMMAAKRAQRLTLKFLTTMGHVIQNLKLMAQMYTLVHFLLTRKMKETRHSDVENDVIAETLI